MKAELNNTTIKIAMKHIYVIERQDGFCKIGVSQDFHNRSRVLSRQGGFTIKEFYLTQPCSNPYELESLIHKDLIKNRVNGEWFQVGFNEAKDVVKNIFKLKANFDVKTQKCITPEDIDRLFQRVGGGKYE